MPNGLHLELKSYLDLVGLIGRCIRADKRDAINPINSPILDQLNIAPENWQKLITQLTKVFHGAVSYLKSLIIIVRA